MELVFKQLNSILYKDKKPEKIEAIKNYLINMQKNSQTFEHAEMIHEALQNKTALGQLINLLGLSPHFSDDKASLPTDLPVEKKNPRRRRQPPPGVKIKKEKPDEDLSLEEPEQAENLVALGQFRRSEYTQIPDFPSNKNPDEFDDITWTLHNDL